MFVDSSPWKSKLNVLWFWSTVILNLFSWNNYCVNVSSLKRDKIQETFFYPRWIKTCRHQKKQNVWIVFFIKCHSYRVKIVMGPLRVCGLNLLRSAWHKPAADSLTDWATTSLYNKCLSFLYLLSWIKIPVSQMFTRLFMCYLIDFFSFQVYWIL